MRQWITTLAAIFAMGASQAAAQQGRKPPVLKAEGSFYVNGVVAPAGVSPTAPQGTGTQIVNQMYVQYRIPEKQQGRKKYPVVMVHGSGHTGKTYETTPDGREGWATYFVRQGFSTYVVDQPGRARSSFDPTLHQQARVTPANPTGNPGLLRSLGGFGREQAWTVFRIGPTAFVPHPNTQFPVEVKDQYFAQLVPNTDVYLADPVPTRVDALASLLEKIGPSVVMVHSMSGTQGLGIALARPDLVKAVVDVEPAGGGCAAAQTTDAQIEAVYKHVPVIVVVGDYIDNFTTAIINTCKPFVDRINAAGGRARFLRLPEVGIFGNSHMLMMDRNSNQIADLIISWLQENLR